MTLGLVSALAVATLALAENTSPFPTGTGSQSQDYIGETPNGDCHSNLVGEPNIGIVCWSLDGTTNSLDLSIHDEYQAHVLGTYSFFSESGITSGRFCDSITGVSIPASASRISVQPFTQGQYFDGTDVQNGKLGTLKSCAGDQAYEPLLKGSIAAEFH